MSKIRMAQIQPDGTIKVLPGSFLTDSQASESITETGEYLFLEVHDRIVDPAATPSSQPGTNA